jgi:hypothetical protein
LEVFEGGEGPWQRLRVPVSAFGPMLITWQFAMMVRDRPTDALPL